MLSLASKRNKSDHQLNCNDDIDTSKRIKCAQQDENIGQGQGQVERLFSKDDDDAASTRNNTKNSININIDSSSMVSAFKLVLMSNHLSSKDIGRVMLRVSRRISSELDKKGEFGWELLKRAGYHHIHFPHPIDNRRILPSSLCPLSLLHCLSKREPAPRPDPPLRSLQYSIEDYTMVISAFKTNYREEASDADVDVDLGGKALFTQCIKGIDIPTFFANGCFRIKMDDGIREASSTNAFQIYEKYNISISMHLLRSDGNTCCIIESVDESKVELEDDEIWFMPNTIIEVQSIEYTQMLYNKATTKIDLHGVVFIVTWDITDHELQVDAYLQDDNEMVDWDGSKVSFAHIIENFYGWGNQV